MKRATFWDLPLVQLLVVVTIVAARLQYQRDKDTRHEVHRLQKLTDRLDDRFWQLKGDWHETEQELSEVRNDLEDVRTKTPLLK